MFIEGRADALNGRAVTCAVHPFCAHPFRADP
jgi:hypothetical protein